MLGIESQDGMYSHTYYSVLGSIRCDFTRESDVSGYSQNSVMIRVRKCATRGIVSLEDDAEAELLMELWFDMQPMPGLSEDMVQQKYL
jgi:hypothetical protein